MPDNLVYAITECVAYVDGVRVVTHVDEPWDANDPVVKKRPDLFSVAPDRVRGTVAPPAPAKRAKKQAAKK